MKTPREWVREKFKERCDGHSDTCLCGDVLAIIEARDAEWRGQPPGGTPDVLVAALEEAAQRCDERARMHLARTNAAKHPWELAAREAEAKDCAAAIRALAAHRAQPPALVGGDALRETVCGHQFPDGAFCALPGGHRATTPVGEPPRGEAPFPDDVTDEQLRDHAYNTVLVLCDWEDDEDLAMARDTVHHAFREVLGRGEPSGGGPTLETCQDCKRTIDPETCCCGAGKNDGHDNHHFVPAGCVCFYDKPAPTPVPASPPTLKSEGER